MSAAVAAAAAAAISGYHNSSSTTNSQNNNGDQQLPLTSPPRAQQVSSVSPTPSRYESQKRRDWNTFGQYLKNHRPPLTLSRCSGAHVLEFLRYLDQFGKTKVHTETCMYFGNAHPPGSCPCPLKQAWGSLDALVGRLRAAFEENGGEPEMNPFGARAVRLYLREVRDAQAKARGIAYEKKKRRKPQQQNNGSLMEDPDPVHDHLTSRAVHIPVPMYGHGYAGAASGGGGGGFIQLSNSNGTTPATHIRGAAVSYF